MLAQHGDRWLLLFLQRVISAGEQHGDRARRRHCLRSRLVEMFEMVGGQRAILCGQRGAVLVGQLLGVEPDAQAMMGGGLEQALNLVGRERDGLAKGVDAGREALFRRSGDEPVDDLADIMGAAVALIGGQCVQREEGGNDPHRLVLAELARDPEQPQLAFRLEAVSRLDLHRRAAAAHQRVQAAAALVSSSSSDAAAVSRHG